MAKDTFPFWNLTALMLALFSACCGLRHRPHPSPNERTPLIPPSDDAPPPQPRVVDHQKLKERLGSVVRLKEGKMVNVHAQFPFNLHSQDHSSSRSSRNVSGGTLGSSRAASPSPPHALHKSSSTASFRPDADDIPHYLPLAVNPSAPVLNLRLVKSTRATQSTRGRSQRSADPTTRTQAPESPSEEEHHPPTLAVEQDSPVHHPVSPKTPTHPEDFNIQDAGPVARSWGD